MTDEQNITGAEDVEDFCRVCGYDEERFWENGVPTGAICPCCGAKSGIGGMGEPTWEELTEIREYRGHWIGNGAQWRSPTLRPKDWDLLKQIANIPPEWR
ncbi:hypothetical protein [Streptomyces ureilyticus]|uniref:GATA-type domain-containing protein n=1 Tax=Streptomyces ureilyticus TaxID=1775131 RepID=A0ABX0DZU9_9ACTN|nr:hypothetical protein [Streptomyces ureilyticus]NGO47470.1 hypothetical protein [Streptomyces ureilyticus]